MDKRVARYVAGAFLAGVMLFVAGCQKSQSISMSSTEGSGVAALKITASATSPFRKLARSAVLTITASDMSTMSKTLIVTDSSVEGTIKGIAAGKDRLFRVDVYDSIGTLQYYGSAIANIIADSTVHVSISICRAMGSAIINGTVIDSVVDTTVVSSGILLKKDSNTVALWNFNTLTGTTIADESGKGNNGSMFGTTNLITASWGTGIQLAAGCGVKVYDATTLRLSNFEITARVYPNQFTSYNNIVAKEPPGSAAPGGYILRFDNNGYISGYVKYWSWVGVSTPAPVQLNTWYTIRLVKTSTTLTLYVNNQMVSTVNTTVDPGVEVGDLAIGYDVNLVEDRAFRGYIDAIKINKL